MDEITETTKESLSLAAEAIKETSGEVLKIISRIGDDLDAHHDRVAKESQAIRERVHSGARRTSGDL